MGTSAVDAFLLTIGDDVSFVHQEERFVFVKAGDDLSLQCSYEPDVGTRFYWYKQILGQKLRLISSFYKYNSDYTFYGEFNNNPRFKLDTENHKNHLNISDLHISDSGTYYCASSFAYNFDIGEGTTVSVEGSDVNVQALVHQSESESVHPGDSVTLNCTVHTGTCDGERSVYWFKKSEDPQPGIIYTHGGTNDQCERKPDTQTHTCVYNLPILDVNHTHAGTYYCAVASCGHITIGNGTKVDFEKESLVLVYFLSGALGFTTILIVLLSFSVYKMKSKNNIQFSDRRRQRYGGSLPKTALYIGVSADSLHYAALNIRAPNASRRQTNATDTDCVYSSMKK
uniref:Ig-like domain-containing protein n=1 Tax=Sphaeramia orbicularis TaxID=375764 RepID=A0A673CA02_9TELE